MSLSVSPFYRLYRHFKTWRVDDGDPTNSKDFDEVMVSCPASTNEDKNKSWIEVYDAILRKEDGVGYLELEKES
jgi:hypothetical protein